MDHSQNTSSPLDFSIEKDGDHATFWSGRKQNKNDHHAGRPSLPFLH
jgi:hypothetical protein